MMRNMQITESSSPPSELLVRGISGLVSWRKTKRGSPRGPAQAFQITSHAMKRAIIGEEAQPDERPAATPPLEVCVSNAGELKEPGGGAGEECEEDSG